MPKVRQPLFGPLGWMAALVLLALGLVGCGGSKTGGGVAQYYGSYHPSGWIQVHGGDAVKGVDACTKCHEISVIKVGSGVPTCMTTGCHHQSVAGFAAPAIHGLSAKAAQGPRGGSLVSCQICHAKDFSGGASTSACMSCHGVQAPHPMKPWRTSAGSAFSHTTTDPSNAAVCAQCHFAGSPSNPAGHPASPAPAGTQPGCYNATLCHGANNSAPHPIPFLGGQTDSQQNGHLTVTPAAFASDCATCHAYSGTSPLSSAPLCSVCHQLADPTTPVAGVGTCLSCHAGTSGLAMGPAGTNFPSIAGAHAKHLGLLTPLTCNTCHSGSGAGSTTHYNNANARVTQPVGPGTVSMDPTFNSQTGGSAGFSPATLTCSSVSCHGGQTTPSWRTGTLNSAVQCSACHATNGTPTATSQYNDAIGRHAWGTHASAAALDCTICHDMSSANSSPGAVNHFKYLNTHEVSGVATGTPADQMPSGTIKFKLNNATYPITGAATYTISATRPEGDGGCALSCHGETHNATDNHWAAPQGSGVAHPVPFLSADVSNAGNHHMTVTPAQFTAECANCHATTGTSPRSNAPACDICHKLASPLAAGSGPGTCLSCHAGASGLPAGPAGAAFPSIAGAHAKHMALAGLACTNCHNGNGAGTTNHYTQANWSKGTPAGPGTVAFDTTFNAKTGASTFDPASLTCSSVGCHGAQTTPNWQTGNLAVATQCASCHASGTAQYNSYNSGQHNKHSGALCTDCHDVTTGQGTGTANHFKFLATSAMEGPASGTIFFSAAATGSRTYDTNTRQCTLSCHFGTKTQNHNPETW